MDDAVRNGRAGRAETDEAGDRGGCEDGALPDRPVTPGENVAREERLDEPNLSARGDLSMAETRAEGLDFAEPAEVARREVFRSCLCATTPLDGRSC